MGTYNFSVLHYFLMVPLEAINIILRLHVSSCSFIKSCSIYKSNLEHSFKKLVCYYILNICIH